MRACSSRKPSASSTDSQHEERERMYSSPNSVKRGLTDHDLRPSDSPPPATVEDH
jgi:hypothetical protein